MEAQKRWTPKKAVVQPQPMSLLSQAIPSQIPILPAPVDMASQLILESSLPHDTPGAEPFLDSQLPTPHPLQPLLISDRQDISKLGSPHENQQEHTRLIYLPL